MTVIVAIVVALIVCAVFHNFYWKRRHLPPGPAPWPLVGNMLAVLRSGDTGQALFRQWADYYGPVYTVWVGDVPVVMVTDYPLIVETFIKDGDTYTGRRDFSHLMEKIRDGSYGIIMTEGALWRTHRRFALRVLRDFGVGRNLMEEKILREITDQFVKLDAVIAENQADSVDLVATFDAAIGSIVNDLLFGYRFAGDRFEEFLTLKKILHDLLECGSKFHVQLFHAYQSILEWIPYYGRAFREMRDKIGELLSFYRRQIDEHQKRTKSDLSSPPSDYVDAYLRERRRLEEDGEDPDEMFSIRQLIFICWDLWLAGQETTSLTMRWGAAYILHYPEVQEKLHAELDAVVGDPNRLVTVAEKSQLPYVNAVVNEVQRCANIIPINLAHRTTKDVTIGGHFLPAGTSTTPQISAVLSSDEYFPDAGAFNPSRFIDANGKLAKCEELIPFSVGKRQCPGEPLARMQLFLLIANFYNRYTFLPDGVDPPSLKRTLSGAVAPQPYRCQLRRREKTSPNIRGRIKPLSGVLNFS